MMRKRVYFILSIVVSAAIFSACGAPKQYTIVSNDSIHIQTERPPLDADLAMLVPSGLQQASWMNLVKMRESPLWRPLATLMESHLSDKIPKKIYEELLDNTQEILAASGHRTENDADGYITLFKGDFDSAKVMDNLAGSPQTSAGQLGSFRAIKLFNITFFAPTDRTLAMATPDLAHACVELTQQHGNSLRHTAGFSDLNNPEFGGFISRYIKGDIELHQRNFRDTPFASFRWLNKIERFDATAELNRSMRLSGKAKMDTAKTANRVQSDVSHQLKAITSNALVALLGVKPLINKLQLKTNENNVAIDLNLSSNDINKILKMIEPLMQIRDMLGGK